MSFTDQIRIVWGRGAAQDPDALRQDASGRIHWLWDPPEGSITAKSYAHLLPEREDRKDCVKVGNPKELEAWFYPIDKALIPKQSGGQCEGVIWFAQAGETLCWTEMKMNIITHNSTQYEAELEKALSQVKNTILEFKRQWGVHQFAFVPDRQQKIAITVPAKPARLRQSSPAFQLKARKEMGGIKVFVLSEIELPDIKPKRDKR